MICGHHLDRFLDHVAPRILKGQRQRHAPRAQHQAEPELEERYTSNRAAGGGGKAVRSAG